MSGFWHLTPLGRADMLLEPGEGLDPTAVDALTHELSQILGRNHVQRLFYDVKQVAVIDRIYYDWLVRLWQMCQLYQVELIVVQMQPGAAFALGGLLVGTPPFRCIRDMGTVNDSR